MRADTALNSDFATPSFRLTAWLDRNDLTSQTVCQPIVYARVHEKQFPSCSGNLLLFYSNGYKNVWLMAVLIEEI